VTARTFAVDGVGTLAHDPCTGLTHDVSGFRLTAGRVRVDDALVTAWPTVIPADLLDRTTPVSICWSPIVRCNLACPHCLDDKSLAPEGGGRRREIARILSRSDVLGVDISGGEPLLMRELPDLVGLLLRGGRCTVSVTTNGWLLARRASELTHLDAVRVSLDGPDALSHDRWRGAGSFRRALEGIRACAWLGITLQVQTVLMASNRHLARRMVDLSAEVGAVGLTFLQLLPIGEGAALARDEAMTDSAARALIAELQVPAGLRVRLRERGAAAGFTVLRADGTLWRNGPGATTIEPGRRVVESDDLVLAGKDGSA
jgi:MoaA/NifB/PqqE/SkfB family radical SAM enzyme